jgi:hypothetical protein
MAESDYRITFPEAAIGKLCDEMATVAFGRSTEERADHPIGCFLKYTGRPVAHFFDSASERRWPYPAPPRGVLD